MKRSTGAVVATLVAGVFAAQGCKTEEARKASDAKSTTSKVKCAGVNQCSGKGACSTASNTCAGKNACKGQGWIEVESAKVCSEKGGTLVTTEAPMGMEKKGG